jgi:hypothetical protein
MSHVLFQGTDCREIELYNVAFPRWREWPRWRRWLGWNEPENWCDHGRQLVGDEWMARHKPEFYKERVPWGLISVTYQQLTDRYRKDLNHPAANDFERGIFECRFMSAKQNWKRDWRSILLLWCYKAASNFGGSILRPAWIAAILTLMCAWTYGALINNWWVAWPWHWDIGAAWDSIVTALRVVSLDRSWFSREVDASKMSSFARAVVSVIALVQTALTATLVTLFIFAIRRRFKHSE